MEDLNVCLLNDSFPPEIDGVANAVTNYAQIISRELGRATVVTPAHPGAEDAAFPFPVLRYPSIDLTKKVGYYAGLPFSPETMYSLEGGSFDIIHTHCPITSTMLARMLRDRIDVPVVFTYHTKFDIDIANAVRGKLLQESAAKILAENISACDEIWTVSRGAGENLRKLGFHSEYRVMPNGVDFPKGRVSDELIRKASEGFDLPDGLPVFLFVGRMMWYKGIRIILDALKTLAENGLDFRMVFVGGGMNKDEIIKYTGELQLSEKVLFSEPVRDRNLIRAWYCRADLFLFPSTFDTNGLVVREAAACALGSVLIKGSCASEDVKDGVSGFLIEENALSMAEKLTELCGKRELMAQVGHNAQELIYISWEDAVKNAYSRYHDVIDNYKRGLYPEHRRFSDELFRIMAEGLEDFSRASRRRNETLSELSIRYEKLKNEGSELADDIYRQMGQTIDRGSGEMFFEELPEDYRFLLSELQLGRQQLRMSRESAIRKIRQRLDELNEYLERFM